VSPRRSQRNVVDLGRPTATSNMSSNAEEWGRACEVSANEYSCAHGDQINVVDLSPKLTCGVPKGGGGTLSCGA
jgi:hypothetical protein